MNWNSSEIWDNALLNRNGDIRGMAYGSIEIYNFQLNNYLVWDTNPNRNDNSKALKIFESVRKLISYSEYRDVEELANNKFITKKS